MREKGESIRRLAGRAIGDFGLITEGDRILVALSGGKDSWTLLHVLDQLRKRAPVTFSLVAVTVHPGFPGFRTEIIEAYLREHGYEHRIVQAPVHDLLLRKLSPDETPCALCSRIKRGVLYTQAAELGCTRIALGHHRDDFIETLLLNQFYNGKIKAMAPLLRADDGKNIVIRPLVYVPEDDIVRYAGEAGFPVTCCACPACGDPDQKRVQIKKMLAGLEEAHPGIKASLLASLGHIDLRHLLCSPAGGTSAEGTGRCRGKGRVVPR
ncbi:MAG: tRNA 2-thiocytidine(32) synthetase TtcA [Nitrospirae bacterium GWC2_57_9]|nr:MAG: tRNA 2-thiocytidine(32) synthetase TtcA [Nitrospirae bacterium GWC2_57_9]